VQTPLFVSQQYARRRSSSRSRPGCSPCTHLFAEAAACVFPSAPLVAMGRVHWAFQAFVGGALAAIVAVVQSLSANNPVG